MRFFSFKPETIPSPAEALPGRPDPDRGARHPHGSLARRSPVRGRMGTKTAVFGLGCFWGDEKDFWQLPGVVTTAVGYAGGPTPNPTYSEVCSGQDRSRRGRAGRL